MKKYMVYLDDGSYYGVYKLAIPAKSEKQAREEVKGNGEVVAVKDITNDFPISLSKVREALERSNFGNVEIDLIVRTLDYMNIAE